ncbi:MAG: UDP-N-acetylmuramoyl-L-alanyl-D-glutamate--2,6-diaminopimelate ligase [Rhodospirillaceae bacterium]|nr:UDP-N-acetylmuramoyl-L-alanyl-D-glutamate--2,6-diaminopimelate ligase [Rhodospirillaceae bacterium]MBT6204045.1 UDP-N-acetylmuramoyl-L-alanyl-D-glutamate--2,6-diaminopimelate ligase [Rhodospirillaceae bacterium]MBT6510847.1 UDP-N-acetylmuramoyl-L-alanyl-D-glutamate--2,6-diaminopimelate ligase [Rhodospirillaceae bacterium]MBT7648678.1 UDP-N-acetylmuramoyl-L-alanyl-D-glutamate--2,6-diaminopimelate ligase [Rhodospirillaceae bacterium]
MNNWRQSLQLSVLVDGADAHVVRGPQDIDILGLSADSRDCDKGYLFAALTGSQTDGRGFIADALARGSIAVLTDEAGIQEADVGSATLVGAPQARRSFALICARFFEQQPRTAIAVTGTNGKSSVAEFCRQFWAALGESAATMGTLGVVGDQAPALLARTTPDPVTLHQHLRDLAQHGVERVAIEASSHGLDQCRLDGVRLKAAGFTNLTQDHFDYHPSVEAYLEAKSRLFDLVLPGGTAVLNADIPEFDKLAERCRGRGLTACSYGEAGTDLRLLDRKSLANGHQHLAIKAGDREIDIELPLTGRFQAMNVLCAAGMVAAVEDCSVESVLARAGELTGVRGRLEAVPGHPQGAGIFVDYAHTPDALENVLKAVRGDVAGRLVVVFGCGGDRDRAKRPLMGAIATRLADTVYVTDDNPRTEDADAVRREIVAAAPGALEIGDRRQAIRDAIASLGSGDLLVIAGKGHEAGQTVGHTTLPFDDAQEARRALADLGRGA